MNPMRTISASTPRIRILLYCHRTLILQIRTFFECLIMNHIDSARDQDALKQRALCKCHLLDLLQRLTKSYSSQLSTSSKCVLLNNPDSGRDDDASKQSAYTKCPLHNLLQRLTNIYSSQLSATKECHLVKTWQQLWNDSHSWNTIFPGRGELHF